MMPDLGKYAVEVMSAYGVSLALLGALVALTVARGRRARADLARAEEEKRRHG